MEPFHSLAPPEGSAIEAAQPVRQGVVRGPSFSPIQEGRNNRSIVYPELGLSGNISVAPQRSPEGLQDGGCKGSASVYLWFQVAGFGYCASEVFEHRDEMDRSIIELEGWWVGTVAYVSSVLAQLVLRASFLASLSNMLRASRTQLGDSLNNEVSSAYSRSTSVWVPSNIPGTCSHTLVIRWSMT